MENVNCLRCHFRHEDNGNCTAVGGFCTAVEAAHCPLLREYLDTGLMPEEVLPKKMADEIAMKLLRLADLESFAPYERLRKLAEADKDGRLVVLPCKVGDTVYRLQYVEESPGHFIVDAVPIKFSLIWIDALGETVFLTREDAEKALEVKNG